MLSSPFGLYDSCQVFVNINETQTNFKPTYATIISHFGPLMGETLTAGTKLVIIVMLAVSVKNSI